MKKRKSKKGLQARDQYPGHFGYTGNHVTIHFLNIRIFVIKTTFAIAGNLMLSDNYKYRHYCFPVPF